MRATNTYLFLLSLSLLFASCTPEPIPITLEEAESKPVVWSQAIPNSTTLIYFSRSFSSLAFQEGDSTSAADLVTQFLVSDGRVTLTHAGIVDTLFQVSEGFWATLDTELIPGETYVLSATDYQTQKTINASTRVYAAVPVDTIQYNIIDSSTVDVDVHFTDPPGQNWYAIHYYSAYADPLQLDNPFAAENVVETDLVSDIELNSYNVSIQRTLEFIESDTLYVSLNNISEEYYNYLSQRKRGGTIYNQLIQEPINYVSNVEGGYGMFSLHFPSVRMIVLPE